MEHAGIFSILDQVAYWGQVAFLWLVPLLLLWKLLADGRSEAAWQGALVAVDFIFLIAVLCALVVILVPMILGLPEGEEHQDFQVLARMTGPYAWAFWPYLCCLLLPFLLLGPGMRRSWRVPLLLALFFAVLPFLIEVLTWVIQDVVPAAWNVFPTVPQITLLWVLSALPIAAMLRTRERRMLER